MYYAVSTVREEPLSTTPVRQQTHPSSPMQSHSSAPLITTSPHEADDDIDALFSSSPDTPGTFTVPSIQFEGVVANSFQRCIFPVVPTTSRRNLYELFGSSDESDDSNDSPQSPTNVQQSADGDRVDAASNAAFSCSSLSGRFKRVCTRYTIPMYT